MSYIIADTQYFYGPEGLVETPVHITLFPEKDLSLIDVACSPQHQPYVLGKINETLSRFPNARVSTYRDEEKSVLYVDGVSYEFLKAVFYDTFSLDE